jgi:DNA-binding NarL/FixJ family response regulator
MGDSAVSRVYLVDDHALVRDGMRAVLEASGHEVVGEADQPGAARADIQQLQPDVILLDLHLGSNSGMEVLAELPRRAPEARTIVLTMSPQPQHITEALRLGASGYVLKGSSAREVLAAIQTVLQGRRHLAHDVADIALRATAPDAAPDPLASLSGRERQIATMVVNGLSSAAIGEALHLSPKTVDTYRSRLMTKIGVSDVTALVRWAIRVGLVKDDTV